MAKEKAETKVVRIGDNSDEGEVSGKRLQGFITSLDKIQTKIDQQLQEKREVFADAKAVGYDNKTIRRIMKEQKMEPEKRKEQEELYLQYKAALGIIDDE